MASYPEEYPYTIVDPVNEVDEEDEKIFAHLMCPPCNPQLRVLGDLRMYSFAGPEIASGAYSKIFRGHDCTGATVAVKEFREPLQMDWKQQISILKRVGDHLNVLCLVHHLPKIHVTHSKLIFVFRPVLSATLVTTLADHTIGAWAQVYLLRDLARGLEHLHNNCGIMHRDISPNNLGIDTCTPPRGVLIDLDRATDEPGSYDWRDMTISCMAPEVMMMKLEGTDPMAEHLFPCYERSIDIWALGISPGDMIMGGGYSWNRFGPCKHHRAKAIRDAEDSGFATIDRFPGHRDTLTALSQATNNSQIGQLVQLCRMMTAFKVEDRISPERIISVIDKIVAVSQFLERDKIEPETRQPVFSEQQAIDPAKRQGIKDLPISEAK
ncbi:MAG: hypothetical protein Q9194_005864 [Teloschistes cf. exilis]